ncbi:MAG: secretin N-terminal domain-containing protein [Gemmatimonadota bacterium]
MRRRIALSGRLVLILAAANALMVIAPGHAVAQQTGTRLNYVNADIRDVVRSLGAVLGINVLLSEDVASERVTYTTPEPVPFREVGAVLEAILESEGLVLVRRGPVAEVMPADMAPATGPVYVGKESETPPPLGLITQMVPLDNIGADEAQAILSQLVSPLTRLEAIPRSNSLLITDRGVNVVRYLELLEELDARPEGEGGLRTYVYRLRHANAPDLAATLGQIFGVTVASSPTSQRVEALSDRSLSSNLRGFRQREEQQLDQRRQLTAPLQLQLDLPTDSVGAGAATGGGELLGRTVIVPDRPTNSLVVRTSPPNYPLLQETIAALDIRPAQVLLEVLVAEIQLTEATSYGIRWSIFSEGDETNVLGRLGRPLTEGEFNSIDDLLVEVTRLNSVDVRAILTALATDGKVKVLSTPHILALNNEPARILVGSQVPFNQSTRTGLDVVIDQTVQYRDVGIQLTIVPTINDDGYVSFRVLQEVSQLTTQTIEAALSAPVILTREAETSALVQNAQTVVIGGLIDESSEVIESGVPVLKDIPIVGLLFKNKDTRDVRSELAIFVTPYIVYTDEDAQRLLERETQRLENREQIQEALPEPLPGEPTG